MRMNGLAGRRADGRLFRQQDVTLVGSVHLCCCAHCARIPLLADSMSSTQRKGTELSIDNSHQIGG